MASNILRQIRYAKAKVLELEANQKEDKPKKVIESSGCYIQPFVASQELELILSQVEEMVFEIIELQKKRTCDCDY